MTFEDVRRVRAGLDDRDVDAEGAQPCARMPGKNARAGATIPDRLRAALELRADEPDAIADLGVAYTALALAAVVA